MRDHLVFGSGLTEEESARIIASLKNAQKEVGHSGQFDGRTEEERTEEEDAAEIIAGLREAPRVDEGMPSPASNVYKVWYEDKPGCYRSFTFQEGSIKGKTPAGGDITSVFTANTHAGDFLSFFVSQSGTSERPTVRIYPGNKIVRVHAVQRSVSGGDFEHFLRWDHPSHPNAEVDQANYTYEILGCENDGTFDAFKEEEKPSAKRTKR